jgi:hypothetical protein
MLYAFRVSREQIERTVFIRSFTAFLFEVLRVDAKSAATGLGLTRLRREMCEVRKEAPFRLFVRRGHDIKHKFDKYKDPETKG